MGFEDIIYEKQGQVAWITINRPDRYNAFDSRTLAELGSAFEETGRDRGVGVIVLTGAGEKAFCAGGYLAGLANAESDKGAVYAMMESAMETMLRMRRAPQPVIAAVNGYAIGGGNELVVACDLAIASEGAKFGQTGPKVGSAPVMGGTNMLGLQIGDKRAKEVSFLCRQYTAQEALSMGWINAVVPHALLRAEVEKWCDELLDKSPLCLEIAKLSSNVWWDFLYANFVSSLRAVQRAIGSPEMVEGGRAFMEKRAPDFRKFRS